jgi:hypothetical protein
MPFISQQDNTDIPSQAPGRALNALHTYGVIASRSSQSAAQNMGIFIRRRGILNIELCFDYRNWTRFFPQPLCLLVHILPPSRRLWVSHQ